MTIVPRPIVRERAFHGGFPFAARQTLPSITMMPESRPLRREETLFAPNPPPVIPPLKRKPAMHEIRPTSHDNDQRSIAHGHLPLPQKRRSRRESTVKPREKKRVRFGTREAHEPHRTSRSKKGITVRSILKYVNPSSPDCAMSPQLASRPPHVFTKEARRFLQPGESSRTVPVQYAGPAPGVVGRPRQTNSWMLADRWIEQSTIRGCSLTCKGCRTRITMSVEQPSLARLQKWKRHKAGCERIREWARQEQNAMSLRP